MELEEGINIIFVDLYTNNGQTPTPEELSYRLRYWMQLIREAGGRLISTELMTVRVQRTQEVNRHFSTITLSGEVEEQQLVLFVEKL